MIDREEVRKARESTYRSSQQVELLDAVVQAFVDGRLIDRQDGEVVTTSILNVGGVPLRVIKWGGPSGNYLVVPERAAVGEGEQ
jgi:hypothetical protein